MQMWSSHWRCLIGSTGRSTMVHQFQAWQHLDWETSGDSRDHHGTMGWLLASSWFKSKCDILWHLSNFVSKVLFDVCAKGLQNSCHHYGRMKAWAQAMAIPIIPSLRPLRIPYNGYIQPPMDWWPSPNTDISFFHLVTMAHIIAVWHRANMTFLWSELSQCPAVRSSHQECPKDPCQAGWCSNGHLTQRQCGPTSSDHKSTANWNQIYIYILIIYIYVYIHKVYQSITL